MSSSLANTDFLVWHTHGICKESLNNFSIRGAARQLVDARACFKQEGFVSTNLSKRHKSRVPYHVVSISTCPGIVGPLSAFWVDCVPREDTNSDSFFIHVSFDWRVMNRRHPMP